ncbi:Putative pyridoxamine 5'-phosphate oxidase [Toxocara canis]|uniref:pyridoxal 5'-phosphate synthase n=1 Tax=Toxocara canis TaxID=6265 RepID=A0A0B2VEE9_TOXCA|nr:Putative pyridoxamine 5'-phosphate oxidase [Toxocara canis]
MHNDVSTTKEYGINIKDWRKPYVNEDEPFLLEENLPSKDPFDIFDVWFKHIASKKDASFEEVNAACLSTVCNNRPSSRMILMKEYDREGFSFYTNLESKKARDIKANPQACLLFYWPRVDRQEYDREGFSFYTNLESKKARDIKANPQACLLFYWPRVDRQVRIEGKMELLPAEMAEAYWNSRPVKSRIGSKLSAQSSVIPNRQFLIDKRNELIRLAEEKGDEAITRPDWWGGYRLRPDYFEFWQGQSDRIHDRIVFERTTSGWAMKRLSP